MRTNPVTTDAPVGTGPFKFSDWARGNNISFVRNDDYWDKGKPYLDGLIIRFMPNSSSRVQALLAGEVDFVSSSQFPVSSAKVIKANPNFKLERTGWSPNMLWAFFNLDRKPLSDVRVREALLVATDRHYIFENAFSGSGRPASAPWTVRIPWATDPTIDYDKSHPFDPEKAGKMLEEAGYKADANGVRFKVSVNYSGAVPERNQSALALQAMWKQAGVQLDLGPLENSVLMPRVHKEGNFDVYIASYNSYGDPAIGVAPAFLTETIGMNFGNASHYKNPETDALFAKATQLPTLEERGAVYREIEKILMRDLPNITLHENHGFDAATNRLQGAWGAYGFGQWGNAWLDP
ncbi:MAG: ABC transporter substrate-binding protein [Pararhizobium sp.]